jgi:hypothetical protein
VTSASNATTDGALSHSVFHARFKKNITHMLDILPGYYIVFLALGLAAVLVVFFYSFTRNSNYEVQQRAKKIQEKRQKASKSSDE